MWFAKVKGLPATLDCIKACRKQVCTLRARALSYLLIFQLSDEANIGFRR